MFYYSFIKSLTQQQSPATFLFFFLMERWLKPFSVSNRVEIGVNSDTLIANLSLYELTLARDSENIETFNSEHNIKDWEKLWC